MIFNLTIIEADICFIFEIKHTNLISTFLYLHWKIHKKIKIVLTLSLLLPQSNKKMWSKLRKTLFKGTAPKTQYFEEKKSWK